MMHSRLPQPELCNKPSADVNLEGPGPCIKGMDGYGIGSHNEGMVAAALRVGNAGGNQVSSLAVTH
jgi:hypothetical protein